MKNKLNVIITGASGNIGSKLLNSYSDDKVMGISRNYSSDSKIYQLDNYRKLPACNVLFHLAEENDRNIANKQGKKYVAKTIERMNTLLDQDIKHIIYASSASVYSDKEKYCRRPQESVTPTDFYTEAKIINERRVISAGGTVARLSNVISDTARKGVIIEIIEQLNRGNMIRLIDSSPVRDFIFIDDIISCFRRMESMKKNGIFNIGTGFGTSILDLTNLLADLMNKKITISSKSKRSESNLVLDIKETEECFNWKPEYSLNDSLKKILEKNK